MNLTRSLEHACELASDAAADANCKMVVAVGGDGTIREVVHGLSGSDKPLLIIPGGTEISLRTNSASKDRLRR